MELVLPPVHKNYRKSQRTKQWEKKTLEYEENKRKMMCLTSTNMCHAD